MKNKNKILSNRIVILLIFIFHFLFIPAQNIRDLEKVNKVYIKELKSGRPIPPVSGIRSLFVSSNVSFVFNCVFSL